MANGDAWEGKWRGNWRREWSASTLHTTLELVVSSITTADAHTSAASSRLNWGPCRFKWTGPFRRKMKSGLCACAFTFQKQSNSRYLALRVELIPFPLGLINRVFWYQIKTAERDSTWLVYWLLSRLYFDEILSVISKYLAFTSNTNYTSRIQIQLALTEKWMIAPWSEESIIKDKTVACYLLTIVNLLLTSRQTYLKLSSFPDTIMWVIYSVTAHISCRADSGQQFNTQKFRHQLIVHFCMFIIHNSYISVNSNQLMHIFIKKHIKII